MDPSQPHTPTLNTLPGSIGSGDRKNHFKIQDHTASRSPGPQFNLNKLEVDDPKKLRIARLGSEDAVKE